MAMDGDQLGVEITNEIMNLAAPPDVKISVLQLWQKIGTAIIKHIQDNGQVPAGIPVSTTGSPTSQSGSTTGAGSIE
jgi:hypothetical protein